MIKLKNISYYYLALLGLLLSNQTLGQSFPAESITLFSDRGVYISGEDLSFSGHLSINDEESVLSEVSYVELISPLGQKINQTKVKINKRNFSGKINIPKEALSGYYFLRSYTKWMRNGDPLHYSYILIKIINPLSKEVIEIHDSLLTTEVATFQFDSTASIFNLKDKYKTTEKIELKEHSNKLKNEKWTCLSVIPHFTEPFNIKKDQASNYERLSYIPETRGITISGKVIEKNTQKVLPYYKVSLHINNMEDFIAVQTDTAGRFYFALPDRLGNTEIMVIASSEKKDIEVLIDQDYCTQKIALPVPEFNILPEEKDVLIRMAQSNQIRSLYKHSLKDSLDNSSNNETPFFGHPYKTIDFDTYVNLDSMSQYFTDIPSWVKVKKKDKKRKLVLAGPESELTFSDPIVLIDWIPIDDFENILKLDPRRIKKFDVIVHPYIHGGIIYGGMINFTSRENDFAGFVFPESAMYINFDFYAEQGKEEKIDPTFKNTSTWMPNIHSEMTSSDLSINAPAIPGEYLLLLQGINKSGETIYYKQAFIVE